MNWLHYLLEANIYLAVFYAGYCLFLNKETYYTLNRAYLLLSCLLSFALPVIQVGVLKPVEQPGGSIVIITPENIVTQVTTDTTTVNDVLMYAYLAGVIVLVIVLLIKLSRLIKMTGSSKTLVGNKYKLINIDGSNTAFSFFNYLFIGKNTAGNDTIIRHELVHIRQKHSVDILFLELIRIVNWFNPIIYLMQISLKTVHEYIADEQTAALENDTLAYSAFLVNNAYGLNGSSITHSFFNYNLLKKRIIMLNQKRSGNLARLKYLVAVPLCAGMLCASTLAFSKNYGWVDLAPKHKLAPTANSKSANLAADTSAKTQIKAKAITAKGYKYEETGYLINKKSDFRVIITEKNGEQKEYYKSKAKPGEIAMLKEKYGYSFPKMLIFPKLPPPPPKGPGLQTYIDKMPPPPPAAPKKGAKKLHRMPPPPPAPPIGSDDIDKTPPPPPPASPIGAEDINKMPPPPPPAQPIGSKDLVAMPVPARPVSAKQLKKLNLKAAPVKAVDVFIIGEPKAQVSPAPAIAPADVKPVSPTTPLQ
ncbi:M56 family metallopeptidase [Mucilaginibacter sp.]|uniref:M56 family metallopeptidase n=1 Tax=Mucilaginibacter sp. TaxID=1882438 RepID=UPI0025D44192|nr:M56 family metallopeptidase [Mucilaginibacter sp.]